MIRYIVFAIAGFFSLQSFAQSFQEFDISIESYEITNAPKVQSFAWGVDHESRWLIIGGRTDGLHQRQPFASFLASDNNTSIHLIDPQSKQVWSATLSSLSQKLQEQLQSTNMQFYQKDSFLYTIGGYGYSTTASDHITYPYLTRINIYALSRALENGTSFTSNFLLLEDSKFAVTGGHLGYHNDTFYLAGGQYFEGRYNPMGPDHGPGFIQEYTEEIRMFTLTETATSIALDNYNSWNDPSLHRRDYNMIPQIFSDGSHGFTMFSGVFRTDIDLPYLDMIDFDHNGFNVIDDYSQLLSQYHSAKCPVYDSTFNAMHNFFFGGMSQFTLDQNGNLVEDQDVPFVRTISRMTRFSNDSMQEVKLSFEMPALLGAGAEFIPTGPENWYEHDILMLDRLPQEKTLIGYIFGGIESTAENIFFVNDGSQSDASSLIFKVYLTPTNSASISEIDLNSEDIIHLKLSPNPTLNKRIQLDFNNPSYATAKLSIINQNGKTVKQKKIKAQAALRHHEVIDLNSLSAGSYILLLELDHYAIRKKIIIQ